MNLLITGGTGSLGQALIERYIQSPSLERICIYSRGEHRQEQVKELFSSHKNSDKLRFFIGDIRDKDRLSLAMQGIHLVVHAAALKVVPVIEYNPFEAIKTNVLGAQNLIDCCINNFKYNGHYTKVLAVSTDKAVHPINLYGASKLCAEKLFLAANNIMGLIGPRFSVARYGNVSNSQGSVIPLFRRQLDNNQQLTVTHPDMTRFWITLEEAVKLVDFALNNMIGGEIFVPDMPTFNVNELALTMMESQYPPERVHSRIIGIRPGEKLHETIITKEEMEKTIKINGYYVINAHNIDIPAVMPIHKDYSSDEPLAMSRAELIRKLTDLGAIKCLTPSA